MIGMMKYQSAYLKEAHKVFENAVTTVHVFLILYCCMLWVLCCTHSEMSERVSFSIDSTVWSLTSLCECCQCFYHKAFRNFLS